MKDLKKKLLFMNDFIKIIDLYCDCCDEFFSIEQNKIEHSTLYNYYKNLSENIINCAGKYGMINK